MRLRRVVQQTCVGILLGTLTIALVALPSLATQRLRGRVIIDDLRYSPAAMTVTCGTIATTGNTDCYGTAPQDGVLSGVTFYGTAALATNDDNYITFSVTNLGQAGAGTAVMLATTPAGTNTTKATGGTAITQDAAHALTLAAASARTVVQGDRLRIRAAASGTLNNTVTYATFFLEFAP